MLLPFGNIRSSHATSKTKSQHGTVFNIIHQNAKLIFIYNKDILVSLFREGNKNSSKKMNPVMVREQLRKQFPNVFSLPGETDIKKIINALAQSEKKGTGSKVQNDEEDNILVFGNTLNSQSEK